MKDFIVIVVAITVSLYLKPPPIMHYNDGLLRGIIHQNIAFGWLDPNSANTISVSANND